MKDRMNPEPEDRDRRPSRSQVKRDMTALQVLGERLIGVPENRLAQMDIPEELREAAISARGMRPGGARRRQLQRIGVLMRDVDAVALERSLAQLDRAHHQETRRFRGVESWRDRLIAGDDALLRDILTRHPQAEAQGLSDLVEATRNRPQTAEKRKLFRLLIHILKQESGEIP